MALQPMRTEVPSRAYQSILSSSYGDIDVEDSQIGSATTEEDVNSVIGVSIGRVQTRLKSPTTPAAEKAAALSSLWGDGFFDLYPPAEQIQASHAATRRSSHETQAGKVDEQQDADLDATTAPVTLPTPWVAGPRLFETHPARAEQYGTRKIRPRSGTAAMANLVDLNVKRFMTSFTMPSLPSPSIAELSMPALSSLIGGRRDSPVFPTGREYRRSQSNMSPTSRLPPRTSDAIASKQTPSEAGDYYVLKQNGRSLRRPGFNRCYGSLSDEDGDGHRSPQISLQRTTSDQSLALLRATSRVSSLGGDSRWEHVQKQVNSRAKAISDSLQDSKMKFPTLPSLPTVNLGSLRPDFFRNRATSDTLRPSWPLESDRGGSASRNSGLLEHEDEIMHRTARPDDAGDAAVDTSKASRPPQESLHPHLDRALESLTGDVVILGGYRGSILRSAKPPHRQLWVPFKVGLNIRKVNLEVGLEPEDEERAEESIIASGMLSHIGPVDMGRRLLKRLRSCRNAREGRLRVHDYGYDWRLSPHLLSRRLIRYLEQLPGNAEGVRNEGKGATVIAHSLGGLITRHAVNQCPELFAGVIYAGVPQHCVNILGPLRNGDDVLLSSKVLTAQVNFTLRTSFLLLPENGRCFIDKRTKEEYPVNFFDPAEWKRYALSPCIATTSPPLVSPERKGLRNFMIDSLPSLTLVERMPARDVKSNSESLDKSSIIDVDPHLDRRSSSSSSSTAVQSTIPLWKAKEYLTRTLADTVRFRAELNFIPQCAEWNLYPPLSVLYGDSVPTVYGARVASRATIKCSDAYDNLAFASGDGVCLAKAAMLPKGYECATGGKVKTERGHVGLLGDIEAVGKCLLSVTEGRRKGVGFGPVYRKCENSIQS